MRLFSLALFLGMTVVQEDPAKTARDLIEKFRSGDLVVREEATRKLKELGKAAKAELEKAAKDGDAEVARLANCLLERLTLSEALPPRLQAALPGVADKLAFGGDPAWTVAFLVVALKCGDSSRLPILTRIEIEPLLPRAIRGAASEGDKSAIAEAINKRRLYKPPLDLTPLLEDPDLGFRWSIVEAVNRNPPEAIVKRLIEGTHDEKSPVRGRAIHGLANLLIERAIPEAVRLLKDEDAAVRATAVEALSDMQAKEKAPEIVPLLKDSQNRVKFAALEALGTLFAREAIPAIEERLKDEGEGIRREAVTTLADLDARESIPKIIPLLKDPDEEVRPAAVYALRDLRAREAIPDVKALLSDPEDWVRGAALSFFDEVDPKLAVALALERMKGADTLTRGRVATHLGDLGGPEAVAGLVEALKDKEDHVSANAAVALSKLGDRRGQEVLIRHFNKWPKDSDDEMRALADLGVKEIVPKVISRLEDKSDSTRRAALDALRILGAKEAVSKIEPLLKDPDELVRWQAVIAYAKLLERESIPRLLNLLHDPSSGVVRSALHSLALLNAWDVEAEVARMLEDLEPSVRYVAASWLARAGSMKGVPELLDQDEWPLTALNAVREPEVWKRLDGVAAPGDLQGTILQRIEKAAQAAGLKVVVEPAPLGDSRRTLEREPGENWLGPGDSVVAVFSLVLRTHAVVLEKDRLRLMDRAAGLRFWREWWKDCQASKK